jgi:hypothetical protein
MIAYIAPLLINSLDYYEYHPEKTSLIANDKV